MNKKSILFFLSADNFNEQEFTITYTSLKNSGYNVFIASDAIYFCSGSNGMKVKNDVNIMNIRANNFAGIVIIGGNGIKKYWNNKQLIKIVKEFYSSGKIIAAICAAPVILANAGILKNKNAACHPDSINELLKAGAVYNNTGICKYENIITAAAPQNADDFVKCIINELNR